METENDKYARAAANDLVQLAIHYAFPTGAIPVKSQHRRTGIALFKCFFELLRTLTCALQGIRLALGA